MTLTGFPTVIPRLSPIPHESPTPGHTSSTATPTTRRVRRGWLALALIAMVAVAGCGDDTRMADMVNKERTDRGIHALVWDASLAAKAQAWAETLAARGQLSHSNLSANQEAGWTALGENVAYNTSLEAAHSSLMNSAGHRTNILSGTYTKIGVGVVQSGGYYWVVQEFRAG